MPSSRSVVVVVVGATEVVVVGVVVVVVEGSGVVVVGAGSVVVGAEVDDVVVSPVSPEHATTTRRKATVSLRMAVTS